MEIEEKGSCCEGKGKCDHGMSNCCHNWKKCHMMRRIIMIIVIIIAFCLGTQWGEMRGEFRGGDRFENSKRGSVTVQVQPNTIAPVTPTTTTQ